MARADQTEAGRKVRTMNGFIADWGSKENYLVLFICSWLILSVRGVW